MTAFPYSDTNKRYHTFDYYLKHTYGTKCVKVPLDAGFSCPNRENGAGGCTFCSPRGSGEQCAGLSDSRTAPGCVSPSVKEQLRAQYARLSKKWTGVDLPPIPYFQAYTCTYAPPGRLSEIYREALSFEDGDGRTRRAAAVAIATRPDCVGEDVIGVLSSLAREVPVIVELGLQSIHDDTLAKIRRGHDSACFFDAFHRLHAAGLPVCVHIINGLPGENAERMLATAAALAKEQPEFIKIHMLHILSGTEMEREYRMGEIPLLSKDEYIDVTCRQLELLPPETVVCRLTGDGEGSALLAPDWTRNKRAVLNGIDRWFSEHDSCQGAHDTGRNSEK